MKKDQHFFACGGKNVCMHLAARVYDHFHIRYLTQTKLNFSRLNVRPRPLEVEFRLRSMSGERNKMGRGERETKTWYQRELKLEIKHLRVARTGRNIGKIWYRR